MAQGLPRSRFNSSRLVRALGDLAVADVADSKQSFAERLGQWLGFTDALALFPALGAGAASAPQARSATPAPACHAMRKEFARVRAAMVESITADGVLDPGEARIGLPAPAPDAATASAADFSPYHRRYLAHQRDMAAGIGPLRANARAALSGHSPALERLAAVDAVLEQALAARERNLLATVPALLGRRFEQLHAAQLAARSEAQTADEPALWLAPGGWLAVFCSEMQSVLLAELDLRLQPVAGLIETLGTEETRKQ